MLITRQQVEKACNLTPSELNAAMRAGGYTDRYQTVTFTGMNLSGNFVYEVTGWCNVEGEEVSGRVFLQYRRDAAGDLFLAGDY